MWKFPKMTVEGFFFCSFSPLNCVSYPYFNIFSSKLKSNVDISLGSHKGAAEHGVEELVRLWSQTMEHFLITLTNHRHVGIALS
jgi:phage replication-related protein YjqB (UPF0714/DUF867 family)